MPPADIDHGLEAQDLALQAGLLDLRAGDDDGDSFANAVLVIIGVVGLLYWATKAARENQDQT